MKLTDWLSSIQKTQADLAEIIKREKLSLKRDKVRAHRIFHGAIPNEQEMLQIFTASHGAVTANDFYGIPTEHNDSNNKLKKPRSN